MEGPHSLRHWIRGLDEGEGLYWPYEDNGLVERTVTEERIRYFVANPPEDTRAWTRAMVLRAVSPEEIELVDWDSIRVKVEGRSYWPLYRTLILADPLGFAKAEAEPVFRQAATIGQLVDGLEDLAAGGAPEDRLPEPQRGQQVCGQRN